MWTQYDEEDKCFDIEYEYSKDGKEGRRLMRRGENTRKFIDLPPVTVDTFHVSCETQEVDTSNSFPQYCGCFGPKHEMSRDAVSE